MKRVSTLFAAPFIAALGLLTLVGLGQLPAQIDERFVRDFAEQVPAARYHRDRGLVNAIYGTRLAGGDTPLQSADSFLARWSAGFSGDVGQLQPIRDENGPLVHGAITDPATGTPRFVTFRYQQSLNEIPVFRSGIGFLVRNEADYPLVLTGFNLKDLSAVVATGREAAVISDAMRLAVRDVFQLNRLPQALREVTVDQIEFSEPQLTIWAGVGRITTDAPEVAVQFTAQFGSTRSFPNYQKRLVVASLATGDVLWSESQIQFTDIQGTVSGMATDGNRAAECDPESAFRLPYARVSVSGGNSTYADANGDFVLPHAGTANVTVQSHLIGQYFEVRDQAAGDTVPSISAAVTPPGPVNFLHNATAGQQLSTANVNAYLESNVVRDFVLAYEPNYPVISTQTFFRVNTNLASTCNAFYDGSSINFYQAGGGCSNTAFSDVVHHEYGHHLIDVTNNGQGQMGEGSGDVVGILIQDEPVLAHGFDGNCGSGIRTGDNSIQYPASGAIHTAGQLLSGCVWDTRNELVISEPTDYRDISASLFFGMLIVRGQVDPFNSTIDPLITVLYLQLDDDDGEIGNGTPHYQEIAAGFGVHNMDAPPLNFVNFDYPSGRPQLISPSGGAAFLVEVTPGVEAPLSGSGMLHVDRGSGFESFPMNEISPNLYEANFPSSDLGRVLRYYVSAQSATTATVQPSPINAPQDFFAAISGDSQLFVFQDDFETNQGWTVSTTAIDGPWERGIPAGGGVRGDPPSDGDGSGQCFLTDNVAGNSDVDDGNTTLTSPIFDGSIAANQETVISYFRWYSNVTGDGPESDIFVVQLSNNGGGSWTTLETVGPSGVEVAGGWYHRSFRISDVLAPTDQMRVRYIASDLNPQSIVEAAVDGVEVRRVFQNAAVVTQADIMQTQSGINYLGELADTYDSDDVAACFKPNPVSVSSTIVAEFEGALPTDDPNSLTLVIESKTSRTGVTQTVRMFNFNTGQFENVDARQVTVLADGTATIQLDGDITRFVEIGTGAVVAQLRYTIVPARQFRWFACIDQLHWISE